MPSWFENIVNQIKAGDIDTIVPLIAIVLLILFFIAWVITKIKFKKIKQRSRVDSDLSDLYLKKIIEEINAGIKDLSGDIPLEELRAKALSQVSNVNNKVEKPEEEIATALVRKAYAKKGQKAEKVKFAAPVAVTKVEELGVEEPGVEETKAALAKVVQNKKGQKAEKVKLKKPVKVKKEKVKKGQLTSEEEEEEKQKNIKDAMTAFALEDDD